MMSGNILKCTIGRHVTSGKYLKRLSLNKSLIRNHSNVVTSALPDIQVPNVPIPDYLFQNFHKFPNKVAVECVVTGKKLTYDEIRTKTRNLSKALRKKLKLGKGDVVAILLPNVPEYPICILGPIQAALTVTMINPLYTPEEIKRQLIDSNTKAIITLGALWPLANASAKLTLKKISIISIKMKEGEPTPQGAINFSELIDTAVDIDDITNTNPNDLALLPYSSGTTGMPKGVELTNYNMLANLQQMLDPKLRVALETTETHQDVVPAVLPYFHIYGTTVLMFNHIFHLCKLVSLPKFTPELFISTLIKHQPHVLFVVPPIVLFMASHPHVKQEYFQSVRTVVSGAAPLSIQDEERIAKKAEKDINIIQGYGLTETSPSVCISSLQRKKELGFAGSVGELLPNTTLKVVPIDNPKADGLGPNQPGEFLIKGPQVMKGYHNKPEETKIAFVDGWLRTGDVGYYDSNKMIYLTDRVKELIKVKGYQVAPAELEGIIRSYPDVEDAAVIGIPDEVSGEVPKAFVVPKPNTSLNTRKLEQYVAEKVTPYKRLSGGISLVESIPKNASGKILRVPLKEQYNKK